MAKPAPALTTTRVPLADLERWPGNARRGVVSGIKESMRVNGVFQPLIVQKSTNRIIAGNHRYDALLELHEEQPDEWDGHADVVYLDVNDNRALKMNLADNKTSDDATWDDRALLDQLQAIIEDGDDLLGTGFAPDEVDDLAARLEDELADSFDFDNDDAGEVGERGEKFTDGMTNRHDSIRMIVLTYTSAAYLWVDDVLATLSEKYGTDSNADTVLRALAELTGQEAPENDVEAARGEDDEDDESLGVETFGDEDAE